MEVETKDRLREETSLQQKELHALRVRHILCLVVTWLILSPNVRRRREHYRRQWQIIILSSKIEILESSNKTHNSKRGLIKSAGSTESYKHKR